MEKLKEIKLISAVLPKGVSLRVIKMLKQEKALTTANFSYARGMGKLTPVKYRGVGEQSEKEMLDVVVDSAIADDIFEYIYDVAEINQPHGGMIYMHALLQSTEYVLPEMLEEEH